MLFAKDMMAKCLCDRCCSHMCLVADENHIIRYNNSVYIVTDGKSHMYGWCYCPSGRSYYRIIVGWYTTTFLEIIIQFILWQMVSHMYLADVIAIVEDVITALL